jgi:hypothetical protein
MWILGSFRTEVIFFYLPGLISVVVAILFPELGTTSLVYGLLATALIDSGHVYTTVWRTWLYPDEFKSSNRYWLFPIGIFLFFAFWYYFNLPALWSFVMYATLYHHIRQVYGFSKWYQALNKRTDKISDYLLYSLALFPVIVYHFRPGVPGSYYTDHDLFLFPNLFIQKILILIYSLIWSGWISYELRLWKSGKKEVNRILSIAIPSLIFAYCFMVGNTVTQVLFPLLFVHGIAYCGVMGQTLHRTQNRRFKSHGIALIVVLMTAVIFGLSESWYEENFVRIATDLPAYVTAGIVGLYLTPLFSHYLFDAFIWKRNHRESSLILGKN